MAEALGAAGSIVGIVAFGLQLAAKLQTHVESVVEAGDRLTEIRFDINSTAATLYQLKDLLDKDQGASVRVFPDAGVREIASLATRCSQIYSAITKRLDKVSESSGNGGRKVRISTDGADQTRLQITKLGLRRSLAWPWLEPEIERYQKRLGRVKLDLLLQLQVANLGRFLIENPTLTPESEEQRRILCQLANSFRSPVRSAEKLTGPGTATLFPISPPARAKSGVQLERHRECQTPDTAENGVLNARLEMEESPGGEADDNGCHATSQVSIGAMSLGQDRGVSLHLAPSWVRKIFQSDLRAPCLDWESEEFEAFLLDARVEFGGKAKGTLTKLEVGHLELQGALAEILPLQRRKLRPGVWKKCKSLEPWVRHEVHEAITAVKQWSCKKKIWIAMEIMESQMPHVEGEGSRSLTNGRETSIVLFFRLGEMVEPLRVEYSDRRDILLPYEHCRTWEMTKTILTQAFHMDVSFDKAGGGGEYDIEDAINGGIIAPPMWRSLIRPGMYLRVRPRLCPSTPHGGSHNSGATFTPVPEPNRWPSSSMPTRTIACTRIKREVPTRQTLHAAPSRRVAPCADTRSRLYIDQEIERLLDEEERYANEIDRAKSCVKELLTMWTNAPNVAYHH